MGWLQGPVDSRTAWWFGLQVFWWNRAFAVLQIVSAAALLLNFLNHQQRLRLHSWAADKAHAASHIRVPRPPRLRDVAKWAFPIIIFLAAGIAGLITFFSVPATLTTFVTVFLIFAFFLSLLSAPIISLIIGSTTIYAVVRVGQRYVPPILSWALEASRFERTLAVISFVLFLIASVGQLCLS
ncbi:MAG TPA: hypothetical protein VHD85_12450 [Terracidiphilus sp.]|nr:hypothetical protein [Terracidiphilus sp.]